MNTAYKFVTCKYLLAVTCRNISDLGSAEYFRDGPVRRGNVSASTSSGHLLIIFVHVQLLYLCTPGVYLFVFINELLYIITGH